MRRTQLISVVGLMAAGLIMSCQKPMNDRVVPTAGLRGPLGEDPGATRQYLRTLDFADPQLADSTWTGPLDCDVPACGTVSQVRFRLTPERHAHRRDIQSAVANGDGHIVAKIENLESQPFPPFNMTANDVAYLWVGPLRGGARRVAIVRVDSASGTATELAQATRFNVCRNTGPRSIPAVHPAHDQSCQLEPIYQQSPQGASKAGMIASAGNSSSLLDRLLSRSRLTHGRGLWFSCSLGCCEGSAMQTM